MLLSATHTHSGPGRPLALRALQPDRARLRQAGTSTPSWTASTSPSSAPTSNLAPGTHPPGLGRPARREHQPLARGLPAQPRHESARSYAHDTDKRMTLLRLHRRTDGSEVGLINWFAVHATSMGNDNLLISGDNKGYASYLFEKAQGHAATPRRDTFVAAFAQSNEGDVTPNIYGGTNGGGANDFESTELSGASSTTWRRPSTTTATAPLTGGVDYRHAYVKMDAVEVAPAYHGRRVAHHLPGGHRRSPCWRAPRTARASASEGATCDAHATTSGASSTAPLHHGVPGGEAHRAGDGHDVALPVDARGAAAAGRHAGQRGAGGAALRAHHHGGAPAAADRCSRSSPRWG